MLMISAEVPGRELTVH